MISIQKNVPIPPAPARAVFSKYPWRALDIGESFLAKTGSLKATYRNMHSLARNAGIRLGKTFVVRRTPEGVRVWRTA